MRVIITIGLGLLLFAGWGTKAQAKKSGDQKQPDAVGSLTLVREGRGETVIVVRPKPTVAALFAAQELQEHVRKITGAILPIVRGGAGAPGKRIYVGESEGTKAYGLTNGSFAVQEYTIKFVPDGLILMGRDKEELAVSPTEMLGGVKWVDGKYGPGLSFSNGTLRVKEHGFKDEAGTLEAWVCLPEGGSKEGGEVMRLEGGKPYGYHIVYLQSAPNRVVYSVFNDNTKKGSKVTSGELGAGWHHVMAVHDVKKGKMGLAVDGVSCGEGEYQATTACSNAVLQIGGIWRDGKVVNGLVGSVDEVRISAAAREIRKAEGPFLADADTAWLMHFDEGEGIPGEALGRDGVKAPPDIFDQQGTSYAVHDFLERFCDVRWYGPTELGLVCPERATLEVKGRDIRRKPACIMRNVGGLTSLTKALLDSPALPSESYNNKLKCMLLRWRVGGEQLFGSHSFMGYYDRFWKKNPEHPELFEGEHPEYFVRNWPEGYAEKYRAKAARNRPPQMCYSNPGFIKQVVQDARDFFDGKGLKPGAMAHGDFFALVPMDNEFYCLCPECQKLLDYTRRQTNQYSKGISSDYVMAFANQVAREVKKTHPDKWLVVLAYGDYAWYPAHEKPESNIAVQMCFGLRYWPGQPAGENGEYQIYQDWLGKEKGKRCPLSFWFYYGFPEEYAMMNKSHCFPGFFAHYAAKRLKEFAADGCYGGAYLCGWGEQVDTYVTMKLLDDPSLDVDQLLNEFFDRYYGAASDPMRKIYLRIEEIYCDPNNYKDATPSSPDPGHQTEEIAWKYLGTEKRMAELGRLMDKAKVSAKTEVERKRVALFEKGVWEYMVAGRKLYLGREKIVLKQQALKMEKEKMLSDNQAKLAEIKANPPPIPSVRVTRLPAPIPGADPAKVDWSKSSVFEGWQQVLGLPATRKVSGKLAHDSAYLYIRLEEETDSSRLVAKSGKEFFNGDEWEVFLAIERGKRPYFQVAVNPNGETQLLRYDEQGRPWEKSGVKVVSDKMAKGWNVVVAVPLEKMFPNRVKPGQAVYANFYRATSAWTPQDEPCNRAMLAWSPPLAEVFHNMDRWGEIVLE